MAGRDKLKSVDSASVALSSATRWPVRLANGGLLCPWEAGLDNAGLDTESPKRQFSGRSKRFCAHPMPRMELIITGPVLGRPSVYTAACLSLWEHQEPDGRGRDRGCGPESAISSGGKKWYRRDSHRISVLLISPQRISRDLRLTQASPSYSQVISGV